MTHTVFHAKSSARKWGGKPEDYLPIHDWLDATKEMFCDFRHRALRHHSQGVYEAERVFGHAIVNSDGKTVPVRYIAEQHIKEDCGGIVPSVSDWLKRIPGETWMSRGYQLKDSDYNEIERSAHDFGEGRSFDAAIARALATEYERLRRNHD